MGTSNSFPGPNNKTPLVPDWLEPDGPPLPGEQPRPIPPNEEDQPDQEKPATPQLPNQPPSNRFRSARINLSQFASSGGGNSNSLGRGISHYVTTSSGGSQQATRRMGSSRSAGVKLLGFLHNTLEQGGEKTLQALQLDSLAGHPITEIFLGMIDYICPDGGSVDEGVSRDAFVEMIVDLAENGITDFNSLNPSQVQTVFELYTTHSIEDRLYNDVGTKMIQFPEDVQTVLHIKSQVHDFIHRAVADAINSTRDALLSLTQRSIQGFVDRIYMTAFDILSDLNTTEVEKL